jgi:hypothetical protein
MGQHQEEKTGGNIFEVGIDVIKVNYVGTYEL